MKNFLRYFCCVLIIILMLLHMSGCGTRTDMAVMPTEEDTGNIIIDSGQTEDFEYILYTDNIVEITKYLGNDINLVIPEKINGKDVVSIGNRAFDGCIELVNVTIPGNVNYIGIEAFNRCSNLKAIKIPDSLIYIGSSAFYGCSSLTEITLPKNITEISNRVFQFCTSLTNIEIPNHVVSIGKYAFRECTSLRNVTISDSVTYISSDAFDQVNNELTITCSSGSYTQDYCVREKINYVLYYDNEMKPDDAEIELEDIEVPLAHSIEIENEILDSVDKDAIIFVIELYPEYAPKTVENFVKLASKGFYDGLTFHRIIDGFIAQGGDPQGTGEGGSGETIEGEFSSNGFTQNIILHKKGVVSMVRNIDDPNSASSQFFILFEDSPHLDGDFAAFGQVIEGMEIVDNFQTLERTANSFGETAVPVNPVVMKKVTVLNAEGYPKIQIEIEMKP